jgi:transposase
MTTIPTEKRLRILQAYDNQDGTRQDIADRFGISLGMVKKLLQQRKLTGCIAPRHQNSGRKCILTDFHRERLRKIHKEFGYMTLDELKDQLKKQYGVTCSIQTVHNAMSKMGLKTEGRKYKCL